MTLAAIITALGLSSFAVSSLLFFVRPKAVRGGKPFTAVIMRLLLSLRYSIEAKGLDTLDAQQDKGIIFLPNHPALIDPVIVMSLLYSSFAPRPLSDKDQASKPIARQILKLTNPITLPDLSKNGRRGRIRVKEALAEAVQCLRNCEQIIMYPSGRLCRSAREELASNSGVETILNNSPGVQIVLVRTTGLWGSSFSRANGAAPSLTRHIKKQILALLANGLFFSPRRKVTVEFVLDTQVATLRSRRAINKYLEAFYNKVAQKNITTPYFWWQRSRRKTPPKSVKKIVNGPTANHRTSHSSEYLNRKLPEQQTRTPDL